MNQDRTPFGLRMPPDLKEWTRRTAREQGRSQNNYIVQVLRERMAAGGEFGDLAPAAGAAGNAGDGSVEA